LSLTEYSSGRHEFEAEIMGYYGFMLGVMVSDGFDPNKSNYIGEHLIGWTYFHTAKYFFEQFVYFIKSDPKCFICLKLL